MVCDTRPRERQTLSERKAEVRRAIDKLATLISAGAVKVAVGQQGAVAFDGWLDTDRAFVSDACAYRLLMATANSLTKAKIAQAEALAGRSVSRQVIGQGVHSHDGGHTWHHGH